MLAVAPVCCLGSFCAVLPDGMVPYILCPGMYTCVFGVGAVFCVLRSFAISQVCGFILFVSNHPFFRFAVLPRCPCLIPYDGFAIPFFE